MMSELIFDLLACIQVHVVANVKEGMRIDTDVIVNLQAGRREEEAEREGASKRIAWGSKSFEGSSGQYPRGSTQSCIHGWISHGYMS